MGWNAHPPEVGEDMLGDPVVKRALAGNDALFLGVKGRGVVLEILNDRAGLGPFVENFGLALVKLFAARHLRLLFVVAPLGSRPMAPIPRPGKGGH